MQPVAFWIDKNRLPAPLPLSLSPLSHTHGGISVENEERILALDTNPPNLRQVVDTSTPKNSSLSPDTLPQEKCHTHTHTHTQFLYLQVCAVVIAHTVLQYLRGFIRAQTRTRSSLSVLLSHTHRGEMEERGKERRVT